MSIKLHLTNGQVGAASESYRQENFGAFTYLSTFSLYPCIRYSSVSWNVRSYVTPLLQYRHIWVTAINAYNATYNFRLVNQFSHLDRECRWAGSLVTSFDQGWVGLHAHTFCFHHKVCTSNGKCTTNIIVWSQSLMYLSADVRMCWHANEHFMPKVTTVSIYVLQWCLTHATHCTVVSSVCNVLHIKEPDKYSCPTLGAYNTDENVIYSMYVRTYMYVRIIVKYIRTISSFHSFW